jgi:hypothetical protein
MAYDNDESIQRFEWFLDGGSRGEYGLGDLIKLLAEPNELVRVLLLPKDEEIPLHEATKGFYNFLQFSESLRIILDRSNEMPKLRAGMWFQYAYWFDIVGKRLVRHVNDALSGFLRWERDAAEMAEVQSFVESAASTIAALVRPSIGVPLRNAEAGKG